MVLLSINYRDIRGMRIVNEDITYLLNLDGSSDTFWGVDACGD